MTLLKIALIVTIAVSSTACSQLFKSILGSPTEPGNNSDVRSYLGHLDRLDGCSGRAELRQPAVEDHLADGRSGERGLFGNLC